MTTQEFLERLGKSLQAIAVRIVGICEYYSTNINNDGTFTIVAYQLENAEEIEIDVCFKPIYNNGDLTRIDIESIEMSDEYDYDNKEDIDLRLQYYADELTQTLNNINYKPNWSYYESK
jgi:hypothetical protein